MNPPPNYGPQSTHTPRVQIYTNQYGVTTVNISQDPVQLGLHLRPGGERPVIEMAQNAQGLPVLRVEHDGIQFRFTFTPSCPNCHKPVADPVQEQSVNGHSELVIDYRTVSHNLSELVMNHRPLGAFYTHGKLREIYSFTQIFVENRYQHLSKTNY